MKNIKKVRPAGSLAEQFPKEWNALLGLSDFRERPTELEKALLPIVDTWKPRIMFRKRFLEAPKQLKHAIDEIQKIRDLVAKLPKTKVKVWDGLIRIMYEAKIEGSAPPTVSGSLFDAYFALNLIRFVTSSEPGNRQPDSSSPTKNYLTATVHLHRAWKKLHEKDVYKGIDRLDLFWPHKDKSHPSTVFVLNALRMIDPTIKEARARTAGEKVLRDPEMAARLDRFYSKHEQQPFETLTRDFAKLLRLGPARRKKVLKYGAEKSQLINK